MKITKNIICLGMIPAIILGMEPAKKKRRVESFRSDYIDRRLVCAEQTHRLDLAWFFVRDGLRSIEQCRKVAQCIRKVSPYFVNLQGFVTKSPEAGFAAIVEAVGSTPELRTLEIGRNHFNDLTDSQFRSIRNMILCSRRLISLSCWSCDLGYRKSFAKCKSLLRACCFVQQLKLSQNYLDEESIAIEYAKLLQLLRLRSLDLSYVVPWPTPAVLHKFGPTIQKIRELDFNKNFLGCERTKFAEESWRALADQFMLSEIEELNLRDNWLWHVSTPVWKLLSQAFSHMKHLKKLDLRGNCLFELNSESRELLATGLMRNPNSPTLIIDAKDDPDGFWKEKARFGSFKVIMK